MIPIAQAAAPETPIRTSDIVVLLKFLTFKVVIIAHLIQRLLPPTGFDVVTVKCQPHSEANFFPTEQALSFLPQETPFLQRGRERAAVVAGYQCHGFLFYAREQGISLGRAVRDKT